METAPPTGAGLLHGVAKRRVLVQRALVIAVWATALGLWHRYQTDNHLGPTGVAQRFIDGVELAWWGVAAYFGVYLARPVVLFPASVLTVVGGILFGPGVGIAVVVLAANASALIAYAIGRSLSAASDAEQHDVGEPARLITRWSGRLRTNSFETVLVMRLLFLPYDLVNYAAGVLRIKPAPFLAATALGSLPGTVSFVLLGASLDRVDEGFGGIDTVALVAGLLIFVVSLALARILKTRQRLELT